MYIILVSLLFSCAEPRPPEGGPKDVRPPSIDRRKYSSPNKSVNFKEKQVILTFDEWIKLQAPQSQLVISPPLLEKPDLKIRNKSLVLKWKEPLKDSTTYTIAFGDAVRDITENNIVKNLKFVFSTGPVLDSLSCKGRIVDAVDGSGVSDVLVMLYKNLSDSMPLSQRPYYFSKTETDGSFKIENIGGGQYQIVALKDMNSDYLFNLPNESIAFLDSTFTISDSIDGRFRLRLFQEENLPFAKKAYSKQYGCVRIQFNRVLRGTTQLRLLDKNNATFDIQQGADTMCAWFITAVPDAEELLFELSNAAEKWTDTIKVRNEITNLEDELLQWCLPKEITAADDFSGYRNSIDTELVYVNPFKPLQLNFTSPITAFDTTKINLWVDSTIVVNKISTLERVDSLTGLVSLDTIIESTSLDTFFKLPVDSIKMNQKLGNQLLVFFNKKEAKQYKVHIYPAAINDIYERQNKDTLQGMYVVNKSEQYGSIECTLMNADSTQQYLLQLVDGKGNVLAGKLFRDSSQYSISYPNIEVGNYIFWVVEDANKNGVWDTGLYEKRQQPEFKTISKSIALKPGWENTMEINLKDE